ncbi:MAG: 1-acyl-sn-glycerol-3-phosphate acyltransferase, partial [Flavobacteriales bacterium]
MENFDDIRPYQDNEVPDVIKSLLEDEQFSKAIVDKRLPKLFKKLPTLALLLVKKTLKKKIKKITKVTEVQEIASDYLKKVIKTSVDGLTVSGLQQLKENSYLFMSNHRDIAMDPAFISYLLMEDSKRKLEIAIGDNLLKKEFVSKLMRLNRSFIVKRSAQGREKLLASNKLSEYIHHRLKSGINIWIAQREGRAKDGIDKTDPTILKMLHMSKRKG